MPYYLSKDRKADIALQKQGWTELGNYVHSIDPYRHIVTIHNGRSEVLDPSMLDFDMLQTGSSKPTSPAPSI